MPRDLIGCQRDWQVAFGGPGEGCTLVLGVRHVLRNADVVGRRFLDLVGSLSVCLGVTKRRGSRPEINQACRELCALELVTGSEVLVRWIASKQNPVTKLSPQKPVAPPSAAEGDVSGVAAARAPTDRRGVEEDLLDELLELAEGGDLAGAVGARAVEIQALVARRVV